MPHIRSSRLPIILLAYMVALAAYHCLAAPNPAAADDRSLLSDIVMVPDVGDPAKNLASISFFIPQPVLDKGLEGDARIGERAVGLLKQQMSYPAIDRVCEKTFAEPLATTTHIGQLTLPALLLRDGITFEGVTTSTVVGWSPRYGSVATAVQVEVTDVLHVARKNLVLQDSYMRIAPGDHLVFLVLTGRATLEGRALCAPLRQGDYLPAVGERVLVWGLWPRGRDVLDFGRAYPILDGRVYPQPDERLSSPADWGLDELQKALATTDAP